MQFALKSQPIHLIQLLKAAGICMTGGEAKLLVEEGAVRVDGVTELRKRRQLFAGMVVEVGDERIELVGSDFPPQAG
jgi:ribosome-associated protein